MKLEQAIRTKGIKDIHLKTLLEIIHTASVISNRQTKFFKKYRLSPQQYNILRILRGSDPNPLTIQEIKSRMVDLTPHATRMIDKLEIARLALRKRDLKDRRKIYVHITEKGLGLMEKIDSDMHIFMKYMKNLSREEAKDLTNLLEKLRNQ